MVLDAYKLEIYPSSVSPAVALKASDLKTQSLYSDSHTIIMPSIDLSRYLDDRANLIRQDRALRVDAIKLDDLTPTEAAADRIVRAMRADEAISVWGAEHERIEHPFPGMEFLTSRSVIMKTRVFNVLHKVRSGSFFLFFFSCVCVWVCVS